MTDYSEFPRLEHLLAEWAAAHRLSERQIGAIRANVLATATAKESSLDVDWFLNLLRPVTSLLEQAGEAANSQLSTRALRQWPFSSADDDQPLMPYLQLA
jgi:hypothetical protein